MSVEQSLKQLSRSVLKDKLSSISNKSLSKMSDADLAFWQSSFDFQDPRYRMAEHEWQRRLIVSQLKSTRFAALLGVLGTLLGVVLGKYI